MASLVFVFVGVGFAFGQVHVDTREYLSGWVAVHSGYKRRLERLLLGHRAGI